VAFGLLALIVAAAVRIYGDLSWSSLGEGALTASGCLLFVSLAVLAGGLVVGLAASLPLRHSDLAGAPAGER